MRLAFAHHGLQFFFLTICVEGRQAVLSRLVEGAKRPELTRAGECVRALWRAVHGLNPALTASDYVIMPDHVHLLLIVDYDRDPAFKPLVFLHWFMEESARMIATDGGCAPAPLPRASFSEAGCAPAPLPRATFSEAGCAPAPLPRASFSEAGCAPAPLPPLPTTMRRVYCPSSVGVSSIGGAGAQPAPGSRSPGRGAGAQPPSVAAFWERRFWLDLSFSSRQLAAIRRYIRGNPARAIWKWKHPDLFVCHSRIRHPVLDPTLPWSACGDLTLLANPFLVAVSLTRRKTLAEHEPEIAALVEKARQGWVIVCGFLSPGEKELGRRLRAEPRTRWIKTLAQGLPPRYDPSLADSRELAERRMLLLSALPVGAPFDWNTCHRMNDLAVAMCRRARGENEGE